MEFDYSKTCCFTGHKPEKCIGEEGKIRFRLAMEIQNAIAAGYDTFITGMALGVDTWAAEEVLKIKSEKAGIKLVCAVPFEGVEQNRTTKQQMIFHNILSKADDVSYICPKCSRKSFKVRDEWMVDHAAKVIAVFNGTHGGTEYTINYAKQNNREIVLINDGE